MSQTEVFNSGFKQCGSGCHLASAQMVLCKQAEWATVDSTTLFNTKRFMHDGGKDIIMLETLGRLPPYTAKIKNSISEALINLSQTADWKKFAKFGIIKYKSNSDGTYDGPAAQVWANPGENLNIRYY